MNEVRVLKFGGSSVASPDLIHKVAKIVASHYQETQRVVVVVSAMGKSTDQLLNLATEVSPEAEKQHRRELDMMLSVGERISMSLLSMAIRDLGIEAISLTGSQSGIITSDTHGEANILEIKGERILSALNENKVVIVAGFQGVSQKKEITTLGRGGSDTTALALAAFLKSSMAYIYSDIDAYYSCDPKKVDGAIRYTELPWELGFLSSYWGAKVLHHRAAEIAAEHKLEIHLLSTFNPQGNPGFLRGGVNNKFLNFQVFTLNLKKGLQKLTTKIHNGLDNKYLSDLERRFCLKDSSSLRNSPPEISIYSDEKFSRHQAPTEKNFQEFWCLSLVGTGFDLKTALLDESSKLLQSLNLTLEHHHMNSLCLNLFFKPNDIDENKLLNSFHKAFF